MIKTGIHAYREKKAGSNFTRYTVYPVANPDYLCPMAEFLHERIWLSSPHMSGNEMKYIEEAFRNNHVFPLGPNVTGFENDLKKFTGAAHCSCLSSGTAAIHLALVALGVEQGDEVICSTFTFSASANPIVYLKATPVFVDSEPATWNITPTSNRQPTTDNSQLTTHNPQLTTHNPQLTTHNS